MQLNYNQFYVFYLTAKYNSHKEAAKILNISVPAVSMQIKNLENSLGFNLFVRKGTNLSLSKKGMEILPLINATYQKAELLSDKINKMIETQKNKIFLAIHPVPAQEFIPLLTKHMDRHFPNLEIEFFLSSHKENQEKLLNNEVNILISPFEISSKKIFHQKFIESQIVYAVCPKHPLASEKNLKLTQLGQTPTILPHEAGPYQTHILDFYADNNLSLENTKKLGMVVAKRILPHSQFGAFFSDFSVLQAAERGEIKIITLEKQPKPVQFYMACLEKNLDYIFIKSFLEYFSEINTFSAFNID